MAIFCSILFISFVNDAPMATTTQGNTSKMPHLDLKEVHACLDYTLTNYSHLDYRVILVNMEISVILGHEKTKIQNIIDYGKIDVFSVRTNIYIKNKKMGHLI